MPFASAAARHRSHRGGRNVVEVDPSAGELTLPGTAQHQQLFDRLREPIDFGDRRVDLRRRRGTVPDSLCALKPQAQPRQRGTELVRGIRHELSLDAQQSDDPVGHLVERSAERALLAASLYLCPRAQVASRNPTRHLLQPPQRARDLRSDHGAGRQSEGEHDHGDQEKPKLAVANRSMHGGDALRDPHRSDGSAVANDRDGGREDLLAQGLGRALYLDLATARAPR